MLLSYFCEDAYDKLLNELDENNDCYSLETDWLSEYFAGQEYYKTSKTVDVQSFRLASVPGQTTNEQKNEDDLVNTRIVYDAMKKLTPLQAANKYMWTYLCHAVPAHVKYIQNRWMSKIQENTIRERFFVTNLRKSVFDNALSRLWWYGYLTYDEERSNPYELTEMLLINQTVCTDFTDTKNASNRTRMVGVLSAIKEYSDLLDKKEGITDAFRACNKYLNRYAAITVLDLLEPSEIKTLALDYLLKYRSENRRAQ